MPREIESSSPNQVQNYRVPPSDVEAEMATLGSMLLGDRRAIEKIKPILKPSDFYRDANGKIYAAMVELVRRQTPVDVVTVRTILEQNNLLDKCGGLIYLFQLAEYVPTPASIVYYGEIVKAKADLRHIIEVSSEAASLAYRGDLEYDRIVSGVQSALATRVPLDQVLSSEELVDEYMDVGQARATSGKPMGLRSGFPGLDQKTRGFIPGRTYIIGARPRIGKTAIAVNIATTIVKANPPGTVMFFTLEMSKMELMDRAVACMAGIDTIKLETGQVGPEKFEEVQKALTTLRAGKFSVYDRNIGVEKIVSICSGVKLRRGLSIVFLDYLQFVDWEGDPRTVEREQIKHNMRTLKRMAKSLDVPVVILAQLNRSVEYTDDKMPRMENLDGASEMDKSSDVILLPWRPDIGTGKFASTDNEPCQVIVAKNKFGPEGFIKMHYTPAYTRFTEQVSETMAEELGFGV